ncbi:uncharacterized protein LOC131032289 [Cryptomeria japonica]|uniref:uncharacterized protein LOC131032289 n=1 Tax=Cryptomeria japonica TaxID=3369 RepID=UPI0027DA6BC3|nr:uncharacterized protein LOC131032289 [Cryptomeria japonica]
MAHMNLVLVGKFFGPRPNIEVVRDWVSRKWKGKGQIVVVAMAGGFFSFSFACEEDLRYVLTGGPWMLGKALLALKKWEPGFNPKDRECNKALIWVRLPGLPMEFWGEEIFARIAACFSELILVDPMGEIDHFSKLGRWVEKVEYESIPFSCFHCKKVGHWARKCMSKPKKEWRKRNDKRLLEKRDALPFDPPLEGLCNDSNGYIDPSIPSPIVDDGVLPGAASNVHVARAPNP